MARQSSAPSGADKGGRGALRGRLLAGGMGREQAEEQTGPVDRSHAEIQRLAVTARVRLNEGRPLQDPRDL